MPNLFDLLIIAQFFVIVLLSFIGGLGRVFATLAGLYGGILVAAWFYQTFAKTVVAFLFPNMASFTGDLVGFLLLVLLSTVAIAFALGRSFFVKRLAQRIGVLNNLTGAVLGLIVAIFATVLATMITSLGLQVLNATAEMGSSSTLLLFRNELTNSTLVPLFLKLTPKLIAPLTPFFPSGLPPILAPGSF